MRRVVLEPADRVGLLVEPGLVDVLLRDVGDRPGGLPLLSHALRQTWLKREGDVLTVDGYVATGGIAGAVAQTADSVWTELDAVHQRALRSLLLRLVSITPDGSARSGRGSHDGPPDRPGAARRHRAGSPTQPPRHRSRTARSPCRTSRSRRRGRACAPGSRTTCAAVRVLEHLTGRGGGVGERPGGPRSELYRGSRPGRGAGVARGVGCPFSPPTRRTSSTPRSSHDEDERRAEQKALRVQRRRNRRLRLQPGGGGGPRRPRARRRCSWPLSSRCDWPRRRRASSPRRGWVTSPCANREPTPPCWPLGRPSTSRPPLRRRPTSCGPSTPGPTSAASRTSASPGGSAPRSRLSPDGSRLLAVQGDGIHLVDPSNGSLVPAGKPLLPGDFDVLLYPVGFVDDGATAIVSAASGPDGPDRACELRRFSITDGAAIGAAEVVPGSSCGDFLDDGPDPGLWRRPRARVAPRRPGEGLAARRVWVGRSPFCGGRTVRRRPARARDLDQRRRLEGGGARRGDPGPALVPVHVHPGRSSTSMRRRHGGCRPRATRPARPSRPTDGGSRSADTAGGCRCGTSPPTGSARAGSCSTPWAARR